MQEPFIKNCFSGGVLVTDVQCGGVRRQERRALGTGREMLTEGRQIIISTPAMPRFLPAPSVGRVSRQVQANAL